MTHEPTAIEVLRDSSDPAALTKAAQELAISKDAPSLESLRAALESPKFLDTIDAPVKPPASRLGMKLWKILRSLSDNPDPKARGVIDWLTKSPAYQKHVARVDLLLEATQEVRPPSTDVVNYWKAYAGANDLHAPVLQRILLVNGSPEALAIFRGMMANGGFPPERRINWIRAGVPRYRNDASYLAMVKSLVEDKLVAPEVRLGAVEAVFDWDEEWGPIHGPNVYTPPLRALAPKAARQETREVAEAARAGLSIPTLLDGKISAVLTQLDGLDAGEKPPGG